MFDIIREITDSILLHYRLREFAAIPYANVYSTPVGFTLALPVGPRELQQFHGLVRRSGAVAPGCAALAGHTAARYGPIAGQPRGTSISCEAMEDVFHIRIT